MKKIIILFIVVVLAFPLQACTKEADNDENSNVGIATESSSATTEGTKAQAAYTLSIGMVVTDQDPMYMGAEQFKKQVEDRTKGQVKVEVFHSSKLGDTNELIKSIKEGKDIATIADSGVLSATVKEIGILNAPYLFGNYEQGKKIVSSEKWKSLQDQLVVSEKVKVLSFNWYQGARNLLTNKEIKTPQDLAGLKIRTPGAPVWKETVKAMGGIPAESSWADVYKQIKSGIIDGAEAQATATYDSKLSEVVKYIARTNHIQLVTALIVSPSWFDKLPKEYQDIVVDEAFKAGDFASQKTIELTKDREEKMAATGVKYTDVDKNVFKKATEKVYDLLNYTNLKKEFDAVLGK